MRPDGWRGECLACNDTLVLRIFSCARRHASFREAMLHIGKADISCACRHTSYRETTLPRAKEKPLIFSA